MRPQEGESAAVDLGEKEAARLVNLLSRLVRLSGRPLRSLEKELHLGSSVVSKIFRGVIRPQLSYVVMIAAEIGIPPEDFFALAYKLRRRTAKANPLVRSFLETEGAATAGSDEMIHLTRGELKRLLEQAVSGVLGQVTEGDDGDDLPPDDDQE